MSRTYKSPEEVPNEVLAARLRELASFITKPSKADHERLPSEFYMRIPAEVDHDADIVFCEAARRLTRSGSQGVVTEEVMEFALQCIDGRIGLTENSLFAWSKSDRPEAKERILGIEREAAKQRAMRAALLAAMGGRSEPFEKCSTCGDEIREGEPHRYSSGGLTCWRCLKKSIPPPPTTISEERP